WRLTEAGDEVGRDHGSDRARACRRGHTHDDRSRVVEPGRVVDLLGAEASRSCDVARLSPDGVHLRRRDSWAKSSAIMRVLNPVPSVWGRIVIDTNSLK